MNKNEMAIVIERLRIMSRDMRINIEPYEA